MARCQRQQPLHQQCRKPGCEACRRCCQMPGAAWVRGQMLWAVHASRPCRQVMHPNDTQTHAPNLRNAGSPHKGSTITQM